MPMHVRVSQTGHILHTGPTLRKLSGDRTLVGARLLEIFQLRSPRSVQSIAELRACAGQRIRLQFRHPPKTGFKGAFVLADDGDALLLNLSFGISLVDAIGAHDLHADDFAATDMSVELLYLMEAKSAAMEESRKLNRDLQAAKVAAEEQAFTDTLTGLKNRRAMAHILDRYLAQNRAFGLMQLDLDYFKQVNDRYGHAAGDHVLQKVAEIMVAHTRTDTTLVRAGGDEFVLIFPNMANPESLLAIAERLIAALEEPIPFGAATCRISGSIGIAVINETSGLNASSLLQQIDHALYASKHAGRGCATFFTDGLPTAMPSPAG